MKFKAIICELRKIPRAKEMLLGALRATRDPTAIHHGILRVRLALLCSRVRLGTGAAAVEGKTRAYSDRITTVNRDVPCQHRPPRIRPWGIIDVVYALCQWAGDLMHSCAFGHLGESLYSAPAPRNRRR